MSDQALKALQAASRKALATTCGFLLMAQGYQHSIEDPKFLQYHSLFKEIYAEVDDKLDTFAEHVHSIRAYVPAKFGKLIELSLIAQPERTDVWYTDQDMLYNLYLANSKLGTDLTDAYNKAAVAHKPCLANFLSERMDHHRKHGWTIYSIMKVA